jgi:NhaP-type Na+/H+ or K+/H+ antiporter
VAGLVLVAALRYGLIVASGYEHIFTLAAVVLLFEACGAVVPESGLMAVTVTGVVVGNFKTRVGEELREFKDRLTVMLVGLLFVLLAADVSWQTFALWAVQG